MVVVWLVILRLWITRAIQSTGAYVSNVDALIGKHGRVVVSIEGDNSGQVKVDGEVWSARSHDHTSIEKDSLVVIRRVSGVHLIVKKHNKMF
jgi:membrane protein implicated in regulation of membrane protease activity